MDERSPEQEIKTDKIMELVTRYRQLKTTADKLKRNMDLVKGRITLLVDAKGNWKDDIGYARRITKGESISYSGDLDDIAIAWCQSTDPITQTYGNMVMVFRKVRKSSTYIQIK